MMMRTARILLTGSLLVATGSFAAAEPVTTSTPESSAPSAPGAAVSPTASSPSADPASVAQTPVDAPKSCVLEPAKLSERQIQAFLSKPDSVYEGTADSALLLSSRIRGLATSSSLTLPVIMSLIRTATPDQIAAIGSGLGRAARVCASSQPEYAGSIQVQVASLNNASLVAAFTAATDEVQTAALGATGAAASVVSAGAIGGNGRAGGGTGTLGGDDGVAQTSEDYSFSRRVYFSTNTSANPTSGN